VALATPAAAMRATSEFQHVYGRFLGRAGGAA
jgi:hypothetical protein